MVRFLIDPSALYGADGDDDPDYEPIDLVELKKACKSHKYGGTLLTVGAGLIANGLNIYLIDRTHDKPYGSIMIGYWSAGDWDRETEWFTCWLHEDGLIEAAVSTTSPKPYLDFFQQDLGGPDSVITYFHEPVEEGGTLIRFYLPASDPYAPEVILKFYKCSLPPPPSQEP